MFCFSTFFDAEASLVDAVFSMVVVSLCVVDVRFPDEEAKRRSEQCHVRSVEMSELEVFIG